GIPVGAASAAGILLALGLLLFRHRRESRLAVALVSALAVAFVLAAATTAPTLDTLRVSRSAATLLDRYRPQPDQPLLWIGCREPSLVFLLGTATRLANAEPSEAQLTGAGAALVRDRDDAAFRRSLAARGLNVREVGRVNGVDYSSGAGSVVLILYDL